MWFTAAYIKKYFRQIDFQDIRGIQNLIDKAELNSYIFGGRGWGSYAHLSHDIIIS
jgi:hypothetical protein